MATSQAIRFLDHASDYLRDAKIRGLDDIEVLKKWVAHENKRENPRQEVLEQLARQAELIREQADSTDP